MSGNKKIAVFPAAGKLGTSFCRHLIGLVPPRQLILVSRHPEKIPKDWVDAGAEARKADYDEPETLEGVFDGAAYLFLISYPSIQIDHRFKSHQRAVNAALQCSPGIEHVFYTSLAFGGNVLAESKAHVMQAHLMTEGWLKSLVESRPGLTYTSIREGMALLLCITPSREDPFPTEVLSILDISIAFFNRAQTDPSRYTETYTMYTSFVDLKNPPDTIKIPHSGSGPGIAWVKIDELGEASAKLVTEYLDDTTSARYNNKVIVLAGPKDYSFDELAAILSRVAGKTISIEGVSPEQHSSGPAVVKVMGQDQGTAAAWTTVFEAIEAGEASTVNGELERLLGRKAEDVETTIRKSLAEDTWVRR